MTKFTPIAFPPAGPPTNSNGANLTISTTICGDVCEEFERMAKDNNLTRSALLRQMILYCLERTEDLEALRQRVLIWGS